MTNYLLLTAHRGSYEIDGKKGNAFYLVVVKDGSCKPTIVKCSQAVYNEISDCHCCNLHLYFDEKGKCVSYDLTED